MTVELLNPALRLALVLVAGGAGLLAGILAWRRVRPAAVVLMASVAVGALVVLGIERAVIFVAQAAASDETGFNDHRWVLMAPWSRPVLIGGLVAGVLGLALSWRGN